MSRPREIRRLIYSLLSGSIGGAILLFVLQYYFPNHPPQAPTAQITASEMTGVAPVYVTFDSHESSDDKGVNGLSYQWKIGDAVFSDKNSFSHTFEEPGAHTVTLYVTDSDGLVDLDVVNIEVEQVLDTDGESDTGGTPPVPDSTNKQDLGKCGPYEVALSPLEMKDAKLPVLADFGQEFSEVTGIEISLDFSEDDLWDPGENWFLESVGGQRNITENSKGSTILRIPTLNKHIADQFRSGQFNGFLRAKNGTFRVTEIVLSLVACVD